MDYGSLTDLSGRTAGLTSAASGIGLEAARALTANGAALELMDRDPTTLENAAKDLSAGGASDRTSVVDVTDQFAVNAVAARIHERFGALDIFLNPAGIAMLHSASEVSSTNWRRVINGTFRSCRAFESALVEAGRGSIINLGSMSGTIMDRPRFASSYMASKGVVHQITKALAAERARTGVRANALAPGVHRDRNDTEYARSSGIIRDLARYDTRGPLRDPSNVASLITFVAPDASSYMTGSIVAVDGGHTSI